MANRGVSPSSASSLSMPPSSPDYADQDGMAMNAEARMISPDAEHEGRPKKRQRMTNEAREERLQPVQAIPDDLGDVSEDTDGSVPGSPTHASGGVGAQDEEALAGEQITSCKWEGCETGDLGNMDNLVEHLHDAHILARQKKYSCEWVDCSRKGIPHASGYALRAHMRSHTREKPFYCSLPECDRSFTRSDALAKHMRTVHETEALRPSDPVPKHHSSNPSNKFQRLRLTIKAGNGSVGGGGPGSDKSAPASPSTIVQQAYPNPSETSYEHWNVSYIPDADGPDYIKQFPPDIQWTEEEEQMHPKDLLQLLQRQLTWAGEDAEELKKEIQELEVKRKEEWIAKELLLENAMEAEMAVVEQREGTQSSKQTLERPVLERMEQDAEITKSLELTEGSGGKPWWRDPEKLALKAKANGNAKPLDDDGDVEMAERPEAEPTAA